jgi:hypothetical protein
MSTVTTSLPASARWDPWWSLDALWLGRIVVGRVAHHGGTRNQPRAIFNLQGVGATWHTFPTPEEARAFVEQRLAEWLEQAGLA